MPKKIVDISLREPKIQEIKKKEKKSRFFSLEKLGTFLIFLVIIFGAVVILGLNSKLDLKIKVRLEPVSFEETLQVKAGTRDIIFEERIIPGLFFEEEFEKWQQFETTGISEKTGKAKGKIKLFNNHTPPTPLTLRATTRFLSSQGGKIFRAPQKIYIPPAKISQGKILPGIVEIEVEAQEPGENYNIEPSKFSIPGLSGTPYYYSIWGESEFPMTGGFKKEIKIVTEEDIARATNSLKEELLRETKKSLRGKMPEDFVLLDGAVIEKNLEIFPLQKPGQETLELSLEGKIKIKGLGFKNSQLKEISENLARVLISPSERLLASTLELKIISHNLIIEEEKMNLNLKIEGKIYKDIPLADLSQKIFGKSKREIEEIVLNNFPQVETVEIKLWPFWLRTAPKNPERIRISLTP
ncbi:MAG: hypothetical protein QMC93_01625 [Patescibacteria group bacterium]|nr:hypothetical protein [Patescibacteria group bacterium]